MNTPSNHDATLSAWTTASGVVGGVIKASQLKLQLLTITLDGSLSVVFYAVLSAAAGYITKSAFDYVLKKNNRRK